MIELTKYLASSEEYDANMAKRTQRNRFTKAIKSRVATEAQN